MLDPKIIRIADERIRLEIEDLNHRLGEEIAQAGARANAHGAFYSSGHIIQIFKLCKANLHNKAQLD